MAPVVAPAPAPVADWMTATRAGNYPAAHRISDRVLADRREPFDNPARPYHERRVWDGTMPDGRATLVRCYHGLGDTIMFARFLSALRARAARLTVEAQPELVPLLKPFADRVVAFNPANPVPPAECTLEIMEAFHLLRVTADDLACAPDLLQSVMPCLDPGTHAARPSEMVRRERGRRSCVGGRVKPGHDEAEMNAGICWQAGGWDAARSIPAGALSGLFAGSGLRWVSLTPGAQPPASVAPFPSGDLKATASLIATLTLVVTVDTMIAHLAGALGRPTLLLLRHDADWRWGLLETTPWYSSARLLRQARPGDWGQPIQSALAIIDGYGRATPC